MRDNTHPSADPTMRHTISTTMARPRTVTALFCASSPAEIATANPVRAKLAPIARPMDSTITHTPFNGPLSTGRTGDIGSLDLRIEPIRSTTTKSHYQTTSARVQRDERRDVLPRAETPSRSATASESAVISVLARDRPDV